MTEVVRGVLAFSCFTVLFALMGGGIAGDCIRDTVRSRWIGAVVGVSVLWLIFSASWLGLL